MNVTDRVKNLFFTPKKEWININTEVSTPSRILMYYVLPLAIFSTFGGIIPGLFSGHSGSAFAWKAIINVVSILTGFYISSLVINILAPGFDSVKNMGKSAQLVAYSYTPVWVAGFFSGLVLLLPVAGWILSVLLKIAGWVYSVYLFYHGLGRLKKTPESKRMFYLVIAFVVMVAIWLIISSVLGAIFISIFDSGSLGRGFGL